MEMVFHLLSPNLVTQHPVSGAASPAIVLVQCQGFLWPSFDAVFCTLLPVCKGQKSKWASL